MKIIGHGENGQLILSCTLQELAEAAGFRYPHQLPGHTSWGHSRNGGRPPVGTTVNVGVAWRTIHAMQEANAKMAEAADGLAIIAKAIRASMPEVIVPADLGAVVNVTGGADG